MPHKTQPLAKYTEISVPTLDNMAWFIYRNHVVVAEKSLEDPAKSTKKIDRQSVDVPSP